jgi:hypothetical protein
MIWLMASQVDLGFFNVTCRKNKPNCSMAVLLNYFHNL